MKITDLLSEKTISINSSASSKADIIHQAVALIAASGAIKDVETYEKGVFAREEESTTGIGEGIAIPHCKSSVVERPALAAMVIPEGVDYDALDGEKVNLLFLIAAPNSEDNVHLDVLARLSEMLMDDSFKNALLAAKTKEEFLMVIDEAEGEKLEESEVVDGWPRVLAVTACPTGIAHTYMAEQSLKDKGKEMGISIKVETNGSGGAKNVLTDEEIEHAEGIVIAADVNVETDRFAGKRVVFAAVAEGIHHPDKLINQALDPATPIYKEGQAATRSGSGQKQSIARTIYKHLMSGVSHMLPFVIGGGILIAISFLIDTIAGNAIAGNSSFGSTNAVAAWFNTVGNFAFQFMLWILAGYIAYSIAGRPGLAVGMAGGAMATSTTFNIQKAIEGDSYALTASAGFIGAMIAGFIAGYLVKLLEKAFNWLPKALDSLKPTLIYPILGIGLMGLIMWLLNTPFIYINIGFTNALTWLYENGLILLLCALVAGMMAIDMGGPINKAAYVFGTGMLASAAAADATPELQQAAYMIMAAVMIGGMVPPLGIALSCTLFPQKYSKADRRQGLVNYVMGAGFITEGAIPFAAADPWRVILSSVCGSAVAGVLSGLFGCTLMAPHGGIFVVAVIGNWYWYLLALLIGTVVTGFMLGLLKKDVDNPELGKFKGIRLIPAKKHKEEQEAE